METVSSKVPAHLKEEIEEHAERIGESRSVAVRDLLRAGLDAQHLSIPVPVMLAWIGSLFVASLFTPASDSMGLLLLVIGGLMFAGGLSWPFLAPRLFGRTSR